VCVCVCVHTHYMCHQVRTQAHNQTNSNFNHGSYTKNILLDYFLHFVCLLFTVTWSLVTIIYLMTAVDDEG
jgi:hypothetical protein